MSKEVYKFIDSIEIDPIQMKRFFETLFYGYFGSNEFYNIIKDTFTMVLVDYNHPAISGKNYERDKITHTYLELCKRYSGKDYNDKGSFTDKGAENVSQYIKIRPFRFSTGDQTMGYTFKIKIDNTNIIIKNLSKGAFSWSQELTKGFQNKLKYLLTTYALHMGMTKINKSPDQKLDDLIKNISSKGDELSTGISMILDMKIVIYGKDGKETYGFDSSRLNIDRKQRMYLYDTINYLFKSDEGKGQIIENIIKYINNYYYDIKASR